MVACPSCARASSRCGLSPSTCVCLDATAQHPTWLFLPLVSLPTAMPSPALMDVELWPAPNGSYSLSSLLVNPATQSSANMG